MKDFDLRRDRPPERRGGGVAILISRAVKYKTIHNLYNCNGFIKVCSVKLFLDNGPLAIFSCCRSLASQSIDSGSWLSFLNQSSIQSLFCGDFNAHHVNWESLSCSFFGNSFFNTFENSDYQGLNDGSLTFHRVAHSSNSVIDLAIIHDSLALNAHWKVSNDSWGSDHFPISISLYCNVFSKIGRRKRPKLYSRNLDWN